MSVIAVRILKDQIEVACDSQYTYGIVKDKSKDSASKIFATNKLIVGSSGSGDEACLFGLYCENKEPRSAEIYSMVEFMTEFAKWKHTKTGDHSVTNSSLIIYKGKVFQFDKFFVQEIKKYHSIGIGMYQSQAALYLGHTVEKAVDVACELSIYCDRPIKKYIMNKKTNEIKEVKL